MRTVSEPNGAVRTPRPTSSSRSCGSGGAAFGGASVVIGDFHHVGNVDGAFAFDNCALRMGLALAHVALDHARAFDDDALFLAANADDATAFAFVRTSQDNHFVILLYVKSAHGIGKFKITSKSKSRSESKN